jgi:hypothetical protein
MEGFHKINKINVEEALLYKILLTFLQKLSPGSIVYSMLCMCCVEMSFPSFFVAVQ